MMRRLLPRRYCFLYCSLSFCIKSLFSPVEAFEQTMSSIQPHNASVRLSEVRVFYVNRGGDEIRKQYMHKLCLDMQSRCEGVEGPDGDTLGSKPEVGYAIATERALFRGVAIDPFIPFIILDSLSPAYKTPIPSTVIYIPPDVDAIFLSLPKDGRKHDTHQVHNPYPGYPHLITNIGTLDSHAIYFHTRRFALAYMLAVHEAAASGIPHHLSTSRIYKSYNVVGLANPIFCQDQLVERPEDCTWLPLADSNDTTSADLHTESKIEYHRQPNMAALALSIGPGGKAGEWSGGMLPLHEKSSTEVSRSSHIVGCVFEGGLGNQLFQAAHVLAQGWLSGRPAVFFPRSQIYSAGKDASVYVDNVFRHLVFHKPSAEEIGTYHIAPEESFAFSPRYPMAERHTIFEGYFQSNKNFYGYDEQIRGLFSPPLEFCARMRSKYPVLEEDGQIVVSIHIRRGDYISNDYHHVITVDYIHRGLAHIQGRVLEEKPEESTPMTVFVFSDDMDWAMEHLSALSSNVAIYFIREDHDYEELWLMSLCHHHIISPSSFSWWAAFLNSREDKIVIAPSTWFGPDSNMQPGEWEDIYEPYMVRI